MTERLAVLMLTFLCLCDTAAAEDRADYALPMQRAESGAFTVRGTFGNGSDAELLVDTGSSYVALSPATFAKIKRVAAPTYLRTIRGAMASGRKVEVRVYAIRELTLGRECVLRNLEAVVIPGADRDILGLSALKRIQPFALEFEPPALRFSACQSEPVSAMASVTAGS